jgi:hypothetical protein
MSRKRGAKERGKVDEVKEEKKSKRREKWDKRGEEV